MTTPQVVETLDKARALLDGSVVTIGNFDGVHIGHQAIITAAADRAHDLDVTAVGLTFEPHPVSFFRPDAAPERLTPLPLKARLLREAGVELVVALPFNAELAGLSPERFVEDVLIDGLSARHVVVGEDFRFGEKRAGDTDALHRLGEPKGMTCTAAEWVRRGDEPVSSTRIRRALSTGDLSEANAMLGRPYRFLGTIVRGEARGRTMGYPTANLDPAPMAMPPNGIYITTLARVGGPRWWAATSIGTNPTFGENPRTVETFILDERVDDEDLDLYDAPVELELHQFLRPERRFDSPEQLIAQMDQDVADARHYFSTQDDHGR